MVKIDLLCCCRKPRPDPNDNIIMAPPDNLTIRNISTKTITINQIERFISASPSKSKNIVTSIGNFTKPFTKLLNKKAAPSAAELAAHVKSFEIKTYNIVLNPWGIINNSEIRRKNQSDDEVIRITFTASGGINGNTDATGRYRIDVPTSHKSQFFTSAVISLSNNNVSTTDYTIYYLPSKSHLSFVSTSKLDQWQSRLSDITSISSMSTPGTHNSPTCHIALPSVRCQSVGITAQLRNGVRFFDIRAQPDGKNMLLVHGVFPISLGGSKHLRDVFTEFYEFLDAHPSEVLIVSLKREGPGKATDQEFSVLLRDEFINKKADKWWTEARIPNLGETRGKCILFRRFNLDPSIKEWGINAESWAYNTPDHLLKNGPCWVRVQDFCEILDTVDSNIQHKQQYVREQLVRSQELQSCLDGRPLVKNSGDLVPITLNFLSAANFWNVNCWPERIAAKLNPFAREYLQTSHATGGHGDGSTGVVIADFVGEGGDWGLVGLVVAMNGRLELKEEERRIEDLNRR